MDDGVEETREVRRDCVHVNCDEVWSASEGNDWQWFA